jgi:hypothetical protein
MYMKITACFTPIPYLLCALLLLPLACTDDDNENGGEKKTPPVITLTAPIDGFVANLSDGEDIVFKWKSVETDGYHLVFSTQADFSKADSIKTQDTTLTLTAANLNRRLGRLGVATDERKPVYWTVQPVVANAEIKTKVRTLNITRFATSDVEVVLPADGATIDLKTVGNVVFEWKVTPANAKLIVLLGEKADLSDARPLSVNEPSPLLLPADLVNELLIGYGGEPGKTHTLYWAILFADEELKPDTEIRSLHVKVYASE